MAQTYTRQSSFADGDTITAALFNNEYNQLVNAFAYSSSSASSTGHRHDGTAGQGGNIHTIGDLDFLNKIVVDDSNNRWGVFVEVSSAAVEQIRIQDGAIVPVTDSDIDLGTTGVRFKDAYIDSITTTGNVAVGGNLTVTGTTTFNGGTITMGDAATDNVVFGADVDSNIIPDDDDSYDLGSSSQQWRNLFIDGTANIDSLVADTADINGGTVDGAVIGGSTAAAITGTTITGTAITGTSFVIGSADISEAELETIDGVTAGTVAASKAIVVDSNKDFTGARNITLTGELDAGSLDVSGDVDVDGTLETDALSINGTAVTSTAAELNILDGVTSTAAELNILDGVTSTATELNLLDGVTSTTAELNILDGVTASAADINLIDGITNGTVIASKAIITDANKDITGGRNITISGELDAGSLDISGDADIDGTLEADAITIGGVTLAETISDTVGAMVSSNTETNITVTYEDSDNTLDFVIGTLNQDTTGLAGTATALATARTIHGVSFDGTANIDLSEVVQDTVGAMFSSNTESGITVDYQDGDGTIDLTVGTLNQNTTGSAATLTTARTIGGVSFDGSANITPTTFTTATFSGDVNVDSGLLFADVSANRVGINQASPDVSLDLGANTDAVHVPVGTTAQRPGSPAAGYFRYNSETGDFEGYTDAWGAIAGSGGTAPAVDTMTGDGSDTTLTLTSAPVNENATVVTLDGVVQHKSTYSVSGNTLTFSTAPPSGVAVECITWTNTAINAALLMQDADGDTQIQVEEGSDEDKIRFDTGGTERMIIDNSGRVGIGITSPSDYYNTADDLVIGGSSNHGMTIVSGTSDNGAIFFADGTSGDAEYRGYLIYQQNDDAMRFATAATERMRIDSSGNVGIGTTSVTNALGWGSIAQIGGANPALSLRNSSNVQWDISNFGGTFNIYNGSDARLKIDTSGNVGIGTTSTTTRLNIAPPDNTTANKITFSTGLVRANGNDVIAGGFDSEFVTRDGNVNTGAFIRVIDTNTNSSFPTTVRGGVLTFGTVDGITSSSADATERMRIDNSGNVGIGRTASISHPLDISKADNAYIRISSGTTQENAGIIFANQNTTKWTLEKEGSAHSLFLKDASSTAVTFAQGGNVGIGTTSPDNTLHVDASGGGTIKITRESASTANFLRLECDGTNGNIVSKQATIFNNGDAERMRIDSSGKIGIGQTSPGYFIDIGHTTTTGLRISNLSANGVGYHAQASGNHNYQPAKFFKSEDQGGGLIGQITCTNTATTFATSSDYRLKENVDYTWDATTRLKQLKPARFNFISDSTNTLVDGFIAHEVSSIVPEAITGAKDAVDSEGNELYQCIDHSKLVPLLVKTIQELEARITTLEG